MDRRTFNKLMGSGLVAAATPWALRGASAADEPLKVGFVYLGPVGDFGWTYQHDVARKECDAHFGDKIKTTYVENVPETPDSERVLNDLAAKGNQLIFATSFGYMNYTIKAAQRFPKVMFEHCTGYKRAANVATYNIRFYQGPLCPGRDRRQALARRGVAGYVASVPVPEVVQGMNAFLLGMRSVNPTGTAQIHHDQFLVRSGPGGRCGEGADRPGLRHHHPAHRFAVAAAGGAEPRRQGVRRGDRHDEVRADTASSRPTSMSGGPITSSASRRCSTAPGRARTCGAGSRTACSRCRPSPTCRTT